MRGDRVVDEGVEFIVVYDGSHQGKDLDLLVQIEAPKPEPRWRPIVEDVKPAPKPPTVREPVRNWRLSADRIKAEALLAQQDVWAIVELRVALGMSHQSFKYLIHNLSQAGVTEHPKRGVVRLVRVRVAA